MDGIAPAKLSASAILEQQLYLEVQGMVKREFSRKGHSRSLSEVDRGNGSHRPEIFEQG